MYVIYVYKTTSGFTSAHKYKLIRLNIPKEIRLAKNSPLTFSHNPESLATLSQSKKKIDVSLILSTFAKEKSD